LYQAKWNGFKSLNAEKYKLNDMSDLVALPYILFLTYQFVYMFFALWTEKAFLEKD